MNLRILPKPNETFAKVNSALDFDIIEKLEALPLNFGVVLDDVRFVIANLKLLLIFEEERLAHIEITKATGQFERGQIDQLVRSVRHE